MSDPLNVFLGPEVVRILEVGKNVAHRLREWKKMLKIHARGWSFFLVGGVGSVEAACHVGCIWKLGGVLERLLACQVALSSWACSHGRVTSVVLHENCEGMLHFRFEFWRCSLAAVVSFHFSVTDLSERVDIYVCMCILRKRDERERYRETERD